MTSTGATTAVLDGEVIRRATTTYQAQYALASSDWCTSAGTSGSPASSTSPQALGFTDDTGHEVSE